MVNILLIDDDKRLGDLLKAYFKDFNISLKNATRPSSGLVELENKQYNLIILDIMLPEQDGFEVCKTIRKKMNTPIIMLTARGEVMDRIIGLELGADDYLAKPFEPRELLVRIQNILKRTEDKTNTKPVLVFGELEINRTMLQAKIHSDILPLSHMEYQLLELFALSPQKTFSRDDILNHLKGIDTELYSRSVDILVSRLRQKLKPLKPIKTVRGRGYIFTGAK